MVDKNTTIAVAFDIARLVKVKLVNEIADCMIENVMSAPYSEVINVKTLKLLNPNIVKWIQNVQNEVKIAFW